MVETLRGLLGDGGRVLATHQLMETGPQGRDGLVFFSHAVYVFQFAVQDVDGREEEFEAAGYVFSESVALGFEEGFVIVRHQRGRDIRRLL